MRRMVVDTSNLLFRVVAANQDRDMGDICGLAMHIAIHSIHKHYKKFKPDQVALTFEGNKNWRKDYTRSPKCISKKVYKANRVRDDSSIEQFIELISAFSTMVREHTSLICLSNPILEGDDLFAGYTQRFTAQGDEVIGISGDKDFVQLLKNENFTLINPDTSKPRTLIDTCGVDRADFFMFEKNFRGDSGDNVFSAYPRVLKKRLLKCIDDDYERAKIMNESWTFTDKESGEVREYRVGDLYEENRLLMDLEAQPDYVREAIDSTIDDALANHGKWSFFHFLKFCGKYNLERVADQASTFAEMFSLTGEERPQAPEPVKKKSILSF